jgi:TetR/AcrR family transcriptional regulator, biofilm operon repressor
MTKKEQVKARIGQAAMECFVKFGLDKTTLDDIAGKIGLNKASLYYYYKNKEDIFLDTAIREGEQFISSLQAKALLKKGIQQKVWFYMESRFNYYINVLNMNRISVESLNKILPRFFELYDAMMRQEIQFLSKLLKNAVKDGEIVKTNTESIASVLIHISDALKHSLEQQAILRRETTIDYTKSLHELKFLVGLIFIGLKK